MSKVYDCFMYNGEEDMLEIRLNILDEHVDYFVICEATETFSGKQKPLYYYENKERFAQWNHKIIHCVPPSEDWRVFENAFERAAYQKDYIRTTLNWRNHYHSPINEDDIIYYGDVDEIWKPQTQEGKLRQLAYSYFLNNRSSEDWQGTNMCLYKNLYNLNELRANHDVVLEDGGWHFTNIFSADGIRAKLEAYDHQEMNTEEIKSKIEERITNGEDYLGRKYDWKGNPFVMWKDEIDLPQYLLDNKTTWQHLFQS